MFRRAFGAQRMIAVSHSCQSAPSFWRRWGRIGRPAARRISLSGGFDIKKTCALRSGCLPPSWVLRLACKDDDPIDLQCPADDKGRKRAANSSESFSHMLQAAAIYRQQRTDRIAARRLIHVTPRIVDEGGVLDRFFLRPPLNPANAPCRRRIGFQFGNPAIDRAPARHPLSARCIGPSKAVGARLSRHETPRLVVENRQHIRESLWHGLHQVELPFIHLDSNLLHKGL